jgi:hypothetical protein
VGLMLFQRYVTKYRIYHKPLSTSNLRAVHRGCGLRR